MIIMFQLERYESNRINGSQKEQGLCHKADEVKLFGHCSLTSL